MKTFYKGIYAPLGLLIFGLIYALTTIGGDGIQYDSVGGKILIAIWLIGVLWFIAIIVYSLIRNARRKKY